MRLGFLVKNAKVYRTSLHVYSQKQRNITNCRIIVQGFYGLTKSSFQDAAVHNGTGFPVDHPMRDSLVFFTELSFALGRFHRIRSRQWHHFTLF